MKGSEFVVEIVNLLHYKHHKISLNRAESYVDCFKRLKNFKKKQELLKTMIISTLICSNRGIKSSKY